MKLILLALLLISACGRDAENVSTGGVEETLLPATDFSGTWTGNYPCCGDEQIVIVQTGNILVATKVTGDDYVPAGEITFHGDLDTGIGQYHEAAPHFTNPRFIAATVEVVDANVLRVTSDAAPDPVVEFRR